MSHYSVAVIVPKSIDEKSLNEYVDKALEPFDENLQVEPYIAYTKNELKKKYEEYQQMVFKDKDNVLEKDLSFEDFSNDYCGHGNDEEGNALSTYNPKSKWDWYEIGGRWNNMIETKSSKKVNYARIKDIAFSKKFNDLEKQKMKKDYKELIKEGDFYKPEYYQRRYPTLESYIESFDFSTYAILDKNGKWHESGQMGWFGISSSTPEEEENFYKSYMNLINLQDKNDWLVVVDCHI
ncbi:MAG: hypothetical protein IJH34_07175 [Romboutsia sp.]|nr:hypothetical protein [Romboutsia sp.]